MPEKKEEKRPLDMTTDEAMEFLLGEEGARELKEAVHATNVPPEGDDNGVQAKSKSTQKHNTT